MIVFYLVLHIFLSMSFRNPTFQLVAVLCLSLEYIYCKHLRKPLQKIDKNGWCGIVSMAMGKSLSFTEAVGRVREWQFQSQTLSSPTLSRIRKKFETDSQGPSRRNSGLVEKR